MCCKNIRKFKGILLGKKLLYHKMYGPMTISSDTNIVVSSFKLS